MSKLTKSSTLALLVNKGNNLAEATKIYNDLMAIISDAICAGNTVILQSVGTIQSTVKPIAVVKVLGKETKTTEHLRLTIKQSPVLKDKFRKSYTTKGNLNKSLASLGKSFLSK